MTAESKISNLEKMAWLILAASLLCLNAAMVMGVQGAAITPGASSRANFNQSSSASLPVQAGNVTRLDISGKAISTHWAGFFGNVSGNLTLEDASGNTFYNWVGLGIPTGEVFASNTSTVNWSGISCANSTRIAIIETSLGIASTDADKISATYTNNNHPPFNVSSTLLTGCNSTNAYTNTGQSASLYYQILLIDNQNRPVYTTLINDTATSFTGTTYDFELLVGEADSAGTTSMYFYIEID
ncbi:MAG: hypothetical protein V1866_00545 [archaeon]